jgi:hypothetical protein
VSGPVLSDVSDMLEINTRRLSARLAALAAAALVLAPGGSAGDPAMVMHMDQPAPGVVLGTAPSTGQLREAVAADEFPGTAVVSAVGAAASVLLEAAVPAGEPGVSSLARHVAPSCSGTGRDGNRVQVIYAVEAGSTDRYAQLLTSLRSWVADVDDTFAASAERTGGGRRVRWVHQDCVPVIKREVLPAGALNGFNATISALKARGYDSPTRKYLVFADASQLCGVANLYADSAKTGNANDGAYPQYARVDSPCWAFERGWHSVAAHEVMHMLGGIQDDAPHSTQAGHCHDETDVMCYDDGGTASGMLDVCTGSEDLFDCRNDDYFHTNPAAGSYLARSWNPADSSFLDSVAGPAKAPVVSISGPASMRAGLSTTYTAKSTARAMTYRWAAEPAACLPGGRSAATVRLTCPSWYTGKVQLTLAASAPGTATTRASKTVALLRSPKAAFDAKVKPAAATVKRGEAVKVAVQLRYGNRPVRGTVSLYAKTGDGAWRKITTAKDTGADGRSSWTLRPRQRTQYAAGVANAAGDGWNDANSTRATVRIR